MDFWERLDWLIQEKGLSRKTLTTSLSISESSFAVWKKRHTFPDADVALALARALGVGVEYLLEGPSVAANRSISSSNDGSCLTVVIPNDQPRLQEVVRLLLPCTTAQVEKAEKLLKLLLN